jgi:hypothetical protein
MDEAEKRVLDLSGDLWNRFLQLPVQHPDDQNEFRHHLHALQNIILARPAHRGLKNQLPNVP